MHADDRAPTTEAGSRESTSPTVRRRVLAAELKQLRRSAGLTHVEVARRLGWQQAKVSKIESAKQGVGIDAVIALAEVCRATPEHRDRLVELARAARSRAWWEPYGDVLSVADRMFVGLEAEADAVRVFAQEKIPDLLQVRDYAAATIAAQAARAEAVGLERRLELLLGRQRRVLDERAAEIDVVLAESALHRQVVGASGMRSQLRHLLDLVERPNVTVRVLPFAAGALPVDGAFSILEFHRTPHPDLAVVPTRVGGTYLDESTAVETYREVMTTLTGLSLPEHESAERLREVAGAFADS